MMGVWLLPLALSMHTDNRLDDKCCRMLALKLLPLPPAAHMPATGHDASGDYGHTPLYKHTAQTSDDSGSLATIRYTVQPEKLEQACLQKTQGNECLLQLTFG